jgi:hypothetical protein
MHSPQLLAKTLLLVQPMGFLRVYHRTLSLSSRAFLRYRDSLTMIFRMLFLPFFADHMASASIEARCASELPWFVFEHGYEPFLLHIEGV